MFPQIHIKKTIALLMIISLVVFTAYTVFFTKEIPREFLLFVGIIIGFYYKNEKEAP